MNKSMLYILLSLSSYCSIAQTSITNSVIALNEDFWQISNLFNFKKNNVKYSHNYFTVGIRHIGKKNLIQLDVSYMQKRNLEISSGKSKQFGSGGLSPLFRNSWYYRATTNLDYVGLRITDCFHKYHRSIFNNARGGFQVGAFLHFDILASKKEFNHSIREVKSNNSNQTQTTVTTLDTTYYLPFEALKVPPLFAYAGITLKKSLIVKSFYIEYGGSVGRSFNYRSKYVQVNNIPEDETKIKSKYLMELNFTIGYIFKSKTEKTGQLQKE